MQDPKNVFESLEAELKKRKFVIYNVEIGELSASFRAINANYDHRQEIVSVIADFQTGVTINISNIKGILKESIRNAILRKYMEYFDVTAKGGIEMRIQAELQAFRDIGEVADIITRAYSLAVTTIE